MRVSRVFVALLVVLMAVCQAVPARAEITPDFVKNFLGRYRPAKLNLPPQQTTTATPEDLANMLRNGQLPLSMGDLINLILQNNLDISVNRLSPLSSEYLIDTLYRPWEPSLRFATTINRNTSPSTTILSGASNPSTLSG